MAKPHPSMALLLDLDERLVDNDLRLEIDRCYSYLGTPVVRTHPAGEGAPENAIRMMVRVGAREYLDSTAEGADALWSDSIEHWLLNQVHAVENQMKIFNRRQREEGRDELFFTWLEVELAGGRLMVRLRLDSSCGIDPADSVWVSRVRTALNEGALGEGVVAVQLPSDASYEEQYVAGLAALAARKEAEEAADIVVQARIARDLEAAERGELEKTPEQIVAERIAEEAHLGEDIQKKYALPEADFPIAFDQWTVIYADGTTRDFDAIRGVLAE